MATLTGLLQENKSGNWCYSYDECLFKYLPCQREELHYNLRYNDASAAWVIIASIIVFFMKAGFMLVEVSFARTVRERRNVIVIKHQDAFASAFGFFFLGFDVISKYGSPQDIPTQFFGITDPVLWFFKFTFASNAATIVGGCLVTNNYKLRLPAAFISAFVISGIIHPVIARIIWSDDCHSLSPYRFCTFGNSSNTQACGFDCGKEMSLGERLYVLDFAGGGAVHLLGGVAGLMLCLFAKFQEWRDNRQREERERLDPAGGEQQEEVKPEGFWQWMYPATGGEETVSEAALGVIILWFCWFAFNCGSTESVEVGRQVTYGSQSQSDTYPFYGIPSVIAVNMIMSVASGGTIAVLIASWAQLRYRTDSVNASEIANGILSALVAITAGCPFMDYWGACLTGAIAVILYHIGCYLEYKLGIKDTARVVPVHGVCGLWSLIAVALFLAGEKAECNLHAAFEGLCYCALRLPPLNWGELLLAQVIGALIMIGIAVVGCFLMYGLLYFTPIKPFMWLFKRIFFLDPHRQPPLTFRGGWLLTTPEEDFRMQEMGERMHHPIYPDYDSAEISIARSGRNPKVQMEKDTRRSHLGTHPHSYGSVRSGGSSPPTHVKTSSLASTGPSLSFDKPGYHGTRSNNFEIKENVLLEQETTSESDENL